MSVRLQVYLELERAMMALDDIKDPTANTTANAVRDMLDPIWHALSEKEKDFLNRRTAG